MPYDSGVLSAIIYELNTLSPNGVKIEKIHQPARDEINLQIYAAGERRRFVIDLNASNPKMYISETPRENPAAPPMLCVVLRKYIAEARIVRINQLGFDRVAEFEINGRDAMGYPCSYFMYAEFIRKQPNLILCSHDKKILAAAYTTDFSMETARRILPGLSYAPPNSYGKKNPVLLTKEDFCTDISSAPGEMHLCDWLLGAYQGLSPLTAREIAYRASGDTDSAVGECRRDNVWFYLSQIAAYIREGKYNPVLLKGEDHPLLDIAFMEIRQYEGVAECVRFDSMSALVDTFFGEKERLSRLRQRSQDINKLISNIASKLNRKIRLQESDLMECAGKEKYRVWGDLIISNIHVMKRGMEQLDSEDFYNGGSPVSIPLDIRLTPQQNAQKYYKRYAKMKTAEIHLNEQIKIARAELVYIDTVSEALSRSLSEQELSEIREELALSGYASRVKQKPGQTRKGGASQPSESISPGGFKILCGRNNTQNDRLTFGAAMKSDLWFHVKDIPGSHVVLICGSADGDPEPADLEAAALIAARNSGAKNMPGVTVDYTLCKNVTKPSGSRPGFVTYRNYKSIYVKM